ncbi:class I adenylate-forming enzyme family protein [Actinomadura sp. SCN-SB]|uniref:class I adenylate-forming enzyme family protein n=1 Tax=Actinomadura sp. SCN-SB TaxID=3373092 RepID=UPI003751FEE8
MERTPETTEDPFAGTLLRAGSFWELVTKRAAASGDRVMLLDEHDRRVTFAEFRDRAERAAVALAARGIGPGTRVAWQLPTRISTVLVMAALARIGAVQAPIIPIYGERETGAAIATAGAEFLLVPGTWRGTDYVAMAASLPSAPKTIVVGEDAPQADSADPLPPPAARTEWIYFTSGSSGLPKGARHTDATLLSAAHGWTLQGRVGELPEDVGSMAFPVAHVGGIIYVLTQLMSGFPVVLTEAFDASALEVFRRNKVTMGGGTTVFYTALLAQQRALGPGTRLLPTLRVLKGGGAPCPPAVFWAVREEMDVIVSHDYGMTEVPMICVSSPLDTPEQLAETDGRPIPGNEVRIAEGEVPVADGEDGEIQVRGAAVFHGYTDPSLDEDAFTRDGWFRTGDRGHLRPDGHVEVTGRIKELIIRKGEKIAPLELETLLIRHPAVAEVAVVGLPDPERGERVCAVLTVRGGAPEPSLAEITAFLRDNGLMSRKLPEQVEIVDELPRTGLGKIDKLALRDRFSGR